MLQLIKYCTNCLRKRKNSDKKLLKSVATSNVLQEKKKKLSTTLLKLFKRTIKSNEIQLDCSTKTMI